MQRNIEAIETINGRNGKFGRWFIEVGKPDGIGFVYKYGIGACRIGSGAGARCT